jgi:hypothetical protein
VPLRTRVSRFILQVLKAIVIGMVRFTILKDNNLISLVLQVAVLVKHHHAPSMNEVGTLVHLVQLSHQNISLGHNAVIFYLSKDYLRKRRKISKDSPHYKS